MRTIIDEYRKKCNFLSVQEMLDLYGESNTILNPFSTFISSSVQIGCGNIIYPDVIIESDGTNQIQIGDKNTFFPNTHLALMNGGVLQVGNNNLFGEGIVCIKSNMPSSSIIIGDNVRFEGIINIFGQCSLETGCQILGNISVYNCSLRKGLSYKDADVERRAGLLKGFGNAKGLEVSCGYVIKGNGDFMQDNIEPQLNYHKK